MKLAPWLLLAVLPLTATAGTLNRCEDEQGRVMYSDRPCPGKTVKTLSTGIPPSQSAARSATGKGPVIVYTAPCGKLCADAGQFMRARGVPFTEKNVKADPQAHDALVKLTGTNQVPVLTVGDTVQSGFEANLWNKILEASGWGPAPASAPASAQPDTPKP